MIEAGKTYVVMGLLNSDSIAFAIGKSIKEHGGKVIFSVQNERLKRIFFDRSKDLSQDEIAALDIRYCDVTDEAQVKAFFESTGEISGLVHSIGYANPKTCLGAEFHTDAIEDIKNAFNISAVSLATIVRHAYPHMKAGGSVVALTFESRLAFPQYNWMGVNKAALEAVVRALARRHGKDLIRINAVSAGPIATKAATSIPGFEMLANTWQKISPLPWNVYEEKTEVANAATFLLGPLAKKITGQTIYVDGGASIIGGEMLPEERA
ncbi:MAG: SDR family oxidoreductase [Verrucomicrobia bacterium]|nr:SDR family oxidoreductase [Verrucomicrobiota bacterium]